MARPATEGLGDAIAHLMGVAGISQTELARRLRKRGWPVDQSRVSKWVRGVEAPTALDVYVAIDEECGAKRGTVLRYAGYVDDGPVDTRAAIAADSHLSNEARAMLLDIYDAVLRRATATDSPSSTPARALPAASR